MLFLFIAFFSSLFAIEVEVGQGYECAGLNWSIAGPEKDPNVMSELIWKDLKVWNTRLTGSFELLGYSFFAEWNHGKICDGKVIDDDYGLNDRKGRFSHAIASADKGELNDLTLSVGYPFFCFTPYLGYQVAVQNLKMQEPGTWEYDGRNNLFDPSTVRFKRSLKNLKSSYDAAWYGPLVGLLFKIDGACLQLFSKFEYIWLGYAGRGKWNLRSDIDGPFYHSGDGHGIKWALGGSYELGCGFRVGLLGTWTSYQVKHGKGHIHIIEKGTLYDAYTHLNHVNWDALCFTANLQFGF